MNKVFAICLFAVIFMSSAVYAAPINKKPLIKYKKDPAVLYCSPDKTVCSYGDTTLMSNNGRPLLFMKGKICTRDKKVCIETNKEK